MLAKSFKRMPGPFWGIFLVVCFSKRSHDTYRLSQTELLTNEGDWPESTITTNSSRTDAYET